MQGFSLAVWLLGELSLAGVLYRAWRERLFPEYPYFYTYIVCVAASEAMRSVMRLAFPNIFGIAWWISEFVTAMFGFGVTWEIFTRMLIPYPGVKRMAQFVLRLVFLLLVLRAGVAIVGMSGWRELLPGTAALERNLRVAQTACLLAIAWLIVHYRLPTGRNLRALIFGYGTYLVCQVVSFELLTKLGEPFYRQWGVLFSAQYTLTEVIWCIGMWSFFPNPTPDFELEADYQRVSRRTQRAFGRLRDHLVQSWRA